MKQLLWVFVLSVLLSGTALAYQISDAEISEQEERRELIQRLHNEGFIRGLEEADSGCIAMILGKKWNTATDHQKERFLLQTWLFIAVESPESIKSCDGEMQVWDGPDRWTVQLDYYYDPDWAKFMKDPEHRRGHGE